MGIRDIINRIITPPVPGPGTLYVDRVAEEGQESWVTAPESLEGDRPRKPGKLPFRDPRIF